VAQIVLTTRRRRQETKGKNHDHEKTPRLFRYAGLNLPDPDDRLDVENVRSLYAATYPEITTAALTGPEAVNGKLIYTFTKAIATKG
jgi:PRTRC genetic system protein C